LNFLKTSNLFGKVRAERATSC